MKASRATPLGGISNKTPGLVLLSFAHAAALTPISSAQRLVSRSTSLPAYLPSGKCLGTTHTSGVAALGTGCSTLLSPATSFTFKTAPLCAENATAAEPIRRMRMIMDIFAPLHFRHGNISKRSQNRPLKAQVSSSLGGKN